MSNPIIYCDLYKYLHISLYLESPTPLPASLGHLWDEGHKALTHLLVKSPNKVITLKTSISLVKVWKSNYFKKITMHKGIVLVFVLHYLFGGTSRGIFRQCTFPCAEELAQFTGIPFGHKDCCIVQNTLTSLLRSKLSLRGN